MAWVRLNNSDFRRAEGPYLKPTSLWAEKLITGGSLWGGVANLTRQRFTMQDRDALPKTMDDVAAACESLIMIMLQVKDFNPFLIDITRQIKLSVDAAATAAVSGSAREPNAAAETVPQLVVSEEVVEVEEEEVEEEEEVVKKVRPPYNNVHWPSPLPKLILKEFGCTDRYTHMEALQMLARIFRMSVQTLCVTSRAEIAAQFPLRCYTTHHLRRWFSARY